MPCGCQTACGCDVIAGNGIVVQRLGDTFTITLANDPDSAAGSPVFIQQAPPAFAGPYVWYELDNLGNLVTVWIENGL